MIFAALVQSVSNLPTDPSALESSVSALERDVSALESAIKALESSSAWWEPWVWIFSALVVVGVLMELWLIRHDWQDEWEAFAIWAFVGITRSPARPPKRKLRVEIASVLLIAIGVAGELGAGVKIASVNGKLRGKSSELRSKNAELREKSNQLVSLVNQRSSALDKEASALRLENTRLEAIVQPRTINLEDRKSLARSLIKFAPRFKGKSVQIASLSGDAESSFVALEINDALYRAGIGTDLSGVGRLQWVGIPSTGIEITGNGDNGEFIKAFVTGIHSAAKTEVLAEWGPKCTELRVTVWPKPVPGVPQIKLVNNKCNH